MATPKKAPVWIPCERCGALCEQRNARRRFCSGKCRATVWQSARKDQESRLRGLVTLLAKETGLTPDDFA
jgi:hypothetical protein